MIVRATLSREASREGALGEVFTVERCYILETWNDASDPDVSIARARVGPGIVTALHRLSVDERYVIVSGRGCLEIEGMEPAEVSPGDVALIPRGRAQRIRNIGNEDLLFLCVCTPRFEPEHYQDCEAVADDGGSAP